MGSSVSQPAQGTGKKNKATEVALFRCQVPDQLRVWSTSLFLAIQGIMARSWPPTFSML